MGAILEDQRAWNIADIPLFLRDMYFCLQSQLDYDVYKAIVSFTMKQLNQYRAVL